MYKITIIKTDGSVEQTEQSGVPDYRQIQKAVGGMIETVPYFEKFEGEACVAFCNEEGKLNRLPINEQATFAWDQALLPRRIDDVLVGDVIIIVGSPEELSRL